MYFFHPSPSANNQTCMPKLAVSFAARWPNKIYCIFCGARSKHNCNRFSAVKYPHCCFFRSRSPRPKFPRRLRTRPTGAHAVSKKSPEVCAHSARAKDPPATVKTIEAPYFETNNRGKITIAKDSKRNRNYEHEILHIWNERVNHGRTFLYDTVGMWHNTSPHYLGIVGSKGY